MVAVFRARQPGRDQRVASGAGAQRQRQQGRHGPAGRRPMDVDCQGQPARLCRPAAGPHGVGDQRRAAGDQHQHRAAVRRRDHDQRRPVGSGQRQHRPHQSVNDRRLQRQHGGQRRQRRLRHGLRPQFHVGHASAGRLRQALPDDLFHQPGREPHFHRPERHDGHRPGHRPALGEQRDPGNPQCDGHAGGRGPQRRRRFRGHLVAERRPVRRRLERLRAAVQCDGRSPRPGLPGQLHDHGRAEFSRRGHGRHGRLRDYLAEQQPGRQRLRDLRAALRFPGQ